MTTEQPVVRASAPRAPRRVPSRRYSSRACTECRRKKIKCDDTFPACSNCNMYGRECVYGEDRRRNPASSLRNAVQSTTGTAAASTSVATCTNPPVHTDDHGLNDNFDLSYPIPSIDDVSTMKTSAVSFGGLFTDWTHMGLDLNAFSSDHQFEFLPSSSPESDRCEITSSSSSYPIEKPTSRNETIPSSSSHVAEKPTEPSSMLATRRVSIRSGDDAEGFDLVEEFTQKLTSRLGQLRLVGNGQIRYYGVTSNLHLMDDGLLSLFGGNTRNAREHGDSAIRQAGLHWDGDIAYENHILDLFFAWHAPFLEEVDRVTFSTHKRFYLTGVDTSLYSPALENAMLSVGALYSAIQNSPFDRPAADFFASRAKTYLEIELDSPTFATAQAALVLCCYEGAIGGDSRGWIYAGMAGRIGIDLGVHLSMSGYGKSAETLKETSPSHAQRKGLFWSSYVADVFWGFFTGRPAMLPNLRYTVGDPMPAMESNWCPTISRTESAQVPAGMRTDLLKYVPVELANIARKMTKISDALYTGDFHGLNIESFANSMTTELEGWRVSLPPGFFLETAVPSTIPAVHAPMVIQCNMQYHAAMILLHRPFVADAQSPSNSDEATQESSQVCTRAATAISRLLVMFRATYSWRYVHLQAVHNATIAGVVHAYDSCVSPGKRGKQALEEMHVCIQALGEMGLSFKSSVRGIEVIGAVRREWQSRSMYTAGIKRARMSNLH